MRASGLVKIPTDKSNHGAGTGARVAVTLLLRKRNDKISRFNLSIVGGEESHIHVNDRDREAELAVFHTTTHKRVPFWPTRYRNRTIAFGISLRGRKGVSQLGRKVSHEEKHTKLRGRS